MPTPISNKPPASTYSELNSYNSDIGKSDRVKVDTAKPNDKISEMSDNSQNIGYADIKPSGNQYVPSDIYTDEECSKPATDVNNFISMLMEVPNAALSALGLNGLQEMIVKAMGKLSEETLQLMDDFSAVMSDLAQVLADSARSKAAEAAEEARKQARKSGILSMIMGLVEMIGAAITLAFTGVTGIGAVAAAVMFADGLLKFSVGLAVTIDPSLAGGMMSKMMNSGVFAVFDLIGEGGGQKAMIIFSVLMGGVALLEAGVNLASMAANLGRAAVSAGKTALNEGAKAGLKALVPMLQPAATAAATAIVVASSIMRLIGMIQTMMDQFGDEVVAQNEAMGEEKNKIMENKQAMSMGLVGFIAFKLMSETGGSEALKNLVGDDWDMVIEMITYAVIGILGDFGLGKIAAAGLAKLPDGAWAKGDIMTKLQSKLQLIGFTTQVTQVSTQFQAFMQAKMRKIFSDEKAEMDLLTEITDTKKKAIQNMQQIQNELYNSTFDNITDVSNSANALKQSVLALLRQADRSNVQFG